LQAEIDLAQLLHAADDIVRHLRIFMHDAADAVADVLFDHAVAGVLGVALHARGDLRPPAAFGQLLDCDPEDMLARVDQPFSFGADVADRHADGRVGAPAVQLAGGVALEDVAVAQLALARDAVHDLLVEGDASAGWKRDLWILAGVTLEERRRPVARVD